MKNSRLLNSPRLKEFKKNHQKILIKRIVLSFLLLILISTGLAFLSKWENLNINNIKISGNKVLENKEVENIVREKISGHYFWFFPKTNFLLYPKNEIENTLKNKFKIIKTILMKEKNFKNLEIVLIERTALYTYCGSNMDNPDSEKCYFMDGEGYIFDEAPYFRGEVYLKFYGKTDKEGENPVGSYFFKVNFSQLLNFEENIKKIDISGAVFYVDDLGDIRMFLSSKFKSKLGPEIIFKANSDFNAVIENLQSVLATEPLRSSFRNNYFSLLYIDLRYGNKVYYKFK